MYTTMTIVQYKAPRVKWYKQYLFGTVIVLLLAVFFDTSFMAHTSFKQYLRTLRWTPLPVGVGLALIAFQQYRHTRKREAHRLGKLEPCDCLADEWEVQLYKLLPLRLFSRACGWVNGIVLPEWSRSSLLGFYVKRYGCNMGEAEIEDLNKYRCLADLFNRSLKPSVRPIDLSAEIVSPADGTVLSFGKVDCGMLDQIKGVAYPLRKFLGPNCWTYGGPMIMQRDDNDCYHQNCLQNRENDLFQVVIYLAPGDYHHFHSPADWNISFRRHFPGELLSVNPLIANWIKDLFVLNERVCYVGKWKHGFFSMAAVGATNVGSVKVYFDEDLKTNKTKWKRDIFHDFHLSECIKEIKRGDNFGEFHLGSTIVIVFEAPKGTNICMDVGHKVKVGQALFRLSDSFVEKTSADKPKDSGAWR